MNIGKLGVILNDGPGSKTVFSRSGNQVNLWLYKAVTLSPQNAQYSVSELKTESNRDLSH